MAKAKFDVRTLKNPATSYLKSPVSQQDQTITKAPKEKKDKAEKTGRPILGDEPISKRFSLAFTETEYNTLKENAGRVPLALFIRDALKASKII